MSGRGRFAVAAVLSACAVSAHADKFMRECTEWVHKKGYSVDYIEQRTGERPLGNMAGDWRPNLDPKDAAPGDVLLVALASEGGGQRAEVVDEVLRDADGTIRAFKTSSMNIGKMVEPRCRITENFGKVTQRTVKFDRVKGAWRSARKP